MHTIPDRYTLVCDRITVGKRDALREESEVPPVAMKRNRQDFKFIQPGWTRIRQSVTTG